ncbi:hypothetical protein [Microtetraspora glauca]|uniref:Tat pathway signal sequence domain protein n=1 Tax=Microtetraspora glauca TaxID=1996 RepID=A0ABV3GN62_MICGL
MSRPVMRTAAAALAGLSALILVPPRTAEAASDHVVRVNAAWGWQNTGVYIRKGQTYRVTYLSGSWTVDQARYGRVGPTGYPNRVDAAIVHGCKIVTTAPYGTLIAHRGGTPFAVDTSARYAASYSGWLSLRINDGDFCLSDNAGRISVSIDILNVKQGGNGGNMGG